MDPEAALNGDSTPETVVPAAVPAVEVVAEVAPPAPGDAVIDGEPVEPEPDPADDPGGVPPTGNAALRSGSPTRAKGVAHSSVAAVSAATVPVEVRELHAAEVPDAAPADVAVPGEPTPDPGNGPEQSEPTPSPGTTPLPTPTASPSASVTSAVPTASAAAEPDGDDSDQPSVEAGTDLEISTLGPDVVEELGVDYVAFQVSRPDGQPGDAAWVQADVDVSALEKAGGANFLSRLRLLAFPECVLTTPDVPECRHATVLPSIANQTTKTVSAAVPVSTPETGAAAAGAISRDSAKITDGVWHGNDAARIQSVVGAGSGGVVMAVASGPSGPGGDYRATDLSPTGS